MSNVRVIWYEKALKCYCAMQEIECADADAEFEIESESGERESLPLRDLVAELEVAGCWGWAELFPETGERSIHLWAAQDCDSASLMHMIGHELGHVTGTRADEEWAEENRADEFGDVAAQAYRVMMGRPA